ncbi:peptide MFS transporter [Chryseolinea sp. H1M3-3]|uniref:peptide MFS transporter n=1 Tax=Chryseolinea sp. H1M3-3 TaxID=3034144 RepID=UPI0023EC8E39|nr:peptide MFS transporter [Chryseolinea sp. H1M3-3]
MEHKFFGHPRGLATLFFTEMWERFSYYGMRALLLLYMVASVEEGGLGFDEKTGGAIYGLYTMLVYLLALPGGWLADNLWGLRKTVFYGACIISVGHFLLLLPFLETFFLGLLFIVVGTGMLKPNISSLVGNLYLPHEDARRDAGYSIFFMGINIGAFLAPFITGYLGEKINWHYGFGAAGIGMVLGLIQYKLSEHLLQSKGSLPSFLAEDRQQLTKNKTIFFFAMLIIGLFVLLMMIGIIKPNPVSIARISAYVIAACAVLYFIFLLFFAALENAERKSVLTIAVFFFISVVFYMGYEQQGSSLNLFASRYTDMFIGKFEMPASWLQSVPAVSVLIFAPVFAWLWVYLSQRKLNPSTPVKLSFGLLFVSASYALMSAAALTTFGGQKAIPLWLIMTYVLQTFGEICLYPVGLSAVTKLAPKKYSAQLMGVWFMSLALGNLLAGLIAGEMDAELISVDPQVLVNLFMSIALVIFVVAVIILSINKNLMKLAPHAKQVNG